MTGRTTQHRRPRPTKVSPWLLALTLGSSAGCGHGKSRSPTQLTQAHVAALKADDPAAAYALLAPQIRAATSFEEFEARWKADGDEHAAALEAAQALPPEQAEPIYGGTTTHPGGRVLHWTQVHDQLQVHAGLPGRPNTSTPAQTIRGFIAAVRQAELTRIQALLGEDLLDAVDEDWTARVDAIEDALAEPGALDLSADLRRAELRYETGRVLTLEQTPHGWRITGLR